MNWIKGNADYISGVIYSCRIGELYYTIEQTVAHAVLRVNHKDLFYAPNHQLNAVKVLKSQAKKHYIEQNIIQELISTAKQSTCCKNKVGALLIKDNIIQSRAYNGAPVILDDGDALYHSTLHAEERAILKASDASSCILYTTLSPCLRCAAIILESGIKQVKYLFCYSDTYPIQYLHENGVDISKIKHNLQLKPFNLEKL